MVSHWNAAGEVDGYMPKFWGLFLMPIIATVMYFLFMFLPKTDPYRKNFHQFQGHFDNFVILVLTFLFYVYLLSLAWNLGYHFSIIQFLTPALATLFYYAGVLTSVAKRNWFVGIRTPWTLSSETVWNKTHQLGGRLFKISAAVSLLGVVWPQLATAFLLIPVLTTAVLTFIYSYVQYHHLN